MIGDPDGKSEERNLKSLDEVARNKQAIVDQYKIVFEGLDFKVVDNYDWFKDMGYLNFLRDVGKHVPMRQMLGRDFVQKRLEQDGAGISYAEFSYVLIQGYDFLHLSREHNVRLQICGSDQWGNSIAGVDLIRRITGQEAHVWSSPLIINKATGIKFGKSEGGAVWLDGELTSPYSFYQFWLNVDDEGVEDYLKVYTEIDKQQLDSIMHDFTENRAERLAQKTLAYEVTKHVHGEETANSVRKVSEVLFGSSNYEQLTADDFNQLKRDLTVVTIDATNPLELADVLVRAGLAGSKSEARRFIESKAIYINGRQLPEQTVSLDAQSAIQGHLILRRGKNAQAVVEFSSKDTPD